MCVRSMISPTEKQKSNRPSTENGLSAECFPFRGHGTACVCVFDTRSSLIYLQSVGDCCCLDSKYFMYVYNIWARYVQCLDGFSLPELSIRRVFMRECAVCVCVGYCAMENASNAPIIFHRIYRIVVCRSKEPVGEPKPHRPRRDISLLGFHTIKWNRIEYICGGADWVCAYGSAQIERHLNSQDVSILRRVFIYIEIERLNDNLRQNQTLETIRAVFFSLLSVPFFWIIV